MADTEEWFGNWPTKVYPIRVREQAATYIIPPPFNAEIG